MNLQQPNIRISFIFFFFVALYGFLIANLYRVQIHHADFFRERAQKQYAMTMTVTPPRADIFDRTGIQPLALNTDSISAFIVPSKLENKEKLLRFLERHYKDAAARLKRIKNSHFLYIKRRLSPEEVALIEAHDVSDIKFLKEPSRYYPVTGIGPVVGMTNIDNQGVSGIELMYNATLAGAPFTYTLEKDCRSSRFYITRETLIEGSRGQSITLTIDGVLHFLAYEELKDFARMMGASSASVLICDPTNGDILVMANYPDFNPNSTGSIVQEHTKNRIITDSYELGSVIKGFLALAALEEGKVTPLDLIDCEDRKKTRIAGVPVNTTKQNGIISFEEVIRYSNNIGVAKVAQRLGTKLYDHYSRLGFGKKLGIFPGENSGSITPPARWSNASLISLSFGYEISSNLVQLAQALSIIAQDGYRVPLRLLKAETVAKPEGPLYKPKTIRDIKDILQKTISKGAAVKARLNGYTVMGKTGTARLITNGRYDSTRHIFTFMAIVEKDTYKRVVVVSVKETAKRGLFASEIAAPLFERVAHKMLIHDKIIS